MRPGDRVSHAWWPAAVALLTASGTPGGAPRHAVARAAIRQGARLDPADVTVLLARAQQHEWRLRTGRVALARVTENPPASERELRERIQDPEQLKIELQIARSLPRRRVERVTLLFDNDQKLLLARARQAQGQVAANDMLFTETFRQARNEVREGPKEERQQVLFDKPLWPPYSPYDRWRGRGWSERVAAVKARQITPRWVGVDPATGQAMLRLTGGPDSQLDQKIWLDLRQGDTIARLQILDKKTGRLEVDERAFYRQLPGGIWYPHRLVSSFYSYNRSGERRLTRRETSDVLEARLNVPLPRMAFTIAIDRGVFVQDDRVSPPLVYRQGLTPPTQIRRRHEQQQSQAMLVGQPAPQFALPSLGGETVRTEELRGKVVLLNFFAYHCGPCHAEAPRLEQEFWQRYKDRGVVVLGIQSWTRDDPMRRAQQFAQAHRLTFPLLVDAKDAAAATYRLVAVPTNAVIGKDGRLRYIGVSFTERELQQAIEAALGE
jgi:peroxiredoxin